MAEPNDTTPEEPRRRPALQLKSQRFREAREGDWKTLSSSLDKVGKKGLGAFSIDEILNLPLLYRSAVSSLSMAQSISLDRNMITYLQALCVRAYVFIYGPHTRFKDVAEGYFVKAWPAGVRKLWPELSLAVLVSVVGTFIGWLLCAHDSNWYDLLTGGMAEGRNVSASVKDLKNTLGAGGPDMHDHLPTMAAFLMTHNIQVCVVAFAAGAVFGLPTLMALIQNFYVLGAMLWLFYSKGLGFDFTAWLAIHGTTELSAIILSGACGFHIARRIMFPGDVTRMQALREAGQLTGTVMLGCAIMLIIAGCLEGIGRQTILNPFLRLGVGGVMFIFWVTYFLFTGKNTEARHGQT